MMAYNKIFQIAEVRKSPSARKTISEEMLSAGLAHVYVQSNAVYGDPGHNKMNKVHFLQLVAKAQYASHPFVEIKYHHLLTCDINHVERNEQECGKTFANHRSIQQSTRSDMLLRLR